MTDRCETLAPAKCKMSHNNGNQRKFNVKERKEFLMFFGISVLVGFKILKQKNFV